MITESLTASRMEKLNEERELHGFRNVWTNDGKIFCKLEDSDKPRATVIISNYSEIKSDPGLWKFNKS